MSDNYLKDTYVAAQPENQPFWEAAEEGRLLGKVCTDCEKFHWYPRAICPFCRSSNTRWAPMSGRGKVYACSTLRRADPVYTVAYVELEEGPIMLTNLIEMPETDMRIGVSVQVVFRRTQEGRNAPKFTSASNHE